MEIENASAKRLTDELESPIKWILPEWKKAKSSLAAWNEKASKQRLEVLGQILRDLADRWAELQQDWQAVLQQQRAFVRSPSYAAELERALRANGIPLQGQFPSYEFPPFRLHVTVEEEQCTLTMGRRRERIAALNPVVIGKHAGRRYKSITGKSINQAAICRELLNAYKYANRLHYSRREILWGTPVPLGTLYTLLTLRRESKQEYPLALFLYDLARLKERFPVEYQGYRFEFGFTRDQGRSYDLVDSQGRTSHISSLTIYALEENHAN